MSVADIVLAPLEIAFNRYVDLDTDAWRYLDGLQGKVIAVDVQGLNLTLCVRIGDRAVQLLDDYAGVPDTRLKGTPLALTQLGLTSGDAGAAVRTTGIDISGDLEVGRRFKAFLAGIDIDWEEQLSRIAGDVIAHKIGNLVRGSLAWGRRTVQTAGENVSEYLQEESRDLPRPEEVDAFLSDVDVIRADVDRLAARVQRLQRRVHSQETVASGDEQKQEHFD